MADKWTALNSFWNSFGIPAYAETTIESVSNFDEPVVMSASLWYNSTSWAAISQKAQEISESIGNGGTVIHYTEGAMWVTRGTPFAQRMSDEDTTIKRTYINVVGEYLTAF